MDHNAALAVLKSLADGIHPVTGEVFAPDSPYQRPDVVRALLYAIHILEAPSAASKRPASRPAAGNAGQPWSKEEDEKLLAAFDAGQLLQDIATAHGRSKLAIEARLAKFGRMPMPAGVRSGADAKSGMPQVRDRARPAYAVAR